MTREEAIEVLNMVEAHGLADEAKKMAIQALKHGPNGDAISRQAAIASIKNLYPDMPIMDIFGTRRKWLEKYAPYFECENAVEQLPSVNPQPTGHWIDKGSLSCRCDQCGCKNNSETKFCPNCGSEMKEGDKE